MLIFPPFPSVIKNIAFIIDDLVAEFIYPALLVSYTYPSFLNSKALNLTTKTLLLSSAVLPVPVISILALHPKAVALLEAF